MNLLLNLKEYYKDDRSSALCIVVDVKGSSPGKAGAKMVVFSDGKIDGTVGGGAIEQEVIKDALKVIKNQTSQVKDYNLQDDLSMTCGGSVSVYIEPLSKPAKLYIFGGGHIGKFLARYAPDMGFQTTLIDWREDIFEFSENVPYTEVCKDYFEAINDISFDKDTYCVIVTPNHEMDEDILAAIGKKPAAYLGLIGSKKKIEALTKRFLREDIMTEEELKCVDMPIGIKFRALAPAEIAVSILAKLIDVKNTKVSV